MTNVTDNPEKSRFEMPVEGYTAFVTYRRDGDKLVLPHAEVPPQLEGRGIGSLLVKATLDEIRSRNLKIVPRCPFIAAFIRRNPDYADMVA